MVGFDWAVHDALAFVLAVRRAAVNLPQRSGLSHAGARSLLDKDVRASSHAGKHPERNSERSIGDILVGVVLEHRRREKRNDGACEYEDRNWRSGAIPAQQPGRDERSGAARNQG